MLATRKNIQNNDARSTNDCRFQYFRKFLIENMTKKNLCSNRKESKNSKIHYLLLVMPIDRENDWKSVEKLFGFCCVRCCWVFSPFDFSEWMQWCFNGISYTKQIKHPFKWPKFCIISQPWRQSIVSHSLLYLFVNIIVNRIEIRHPKIMDDQIESWMPKEMENKMKN